MSGDTNERLLASSMEAHYLAAGRASELLARAEAAEARAERLRAKLRAVLDATTYSNLIAGKRTPRYLVYGQKIHDLIGPLEDL